jgi:site-specific recombinase XerD
MSPYKATSCSLFLAFAGQNEVKSGINSRVSPAPRPGKKLLDRVRDAIRLKHYALRTEQVYVDWIRRFILFHGKRHPQSMGAEEVRDFLSHLAREGKVAPSTQNQAFSALLFLYREVLEQELPWIEDIERARRPAKVPLVFSAHSWRPISPRRERARTPLSCRGKPKEMCEGWTPCRLR